ncbi:melanoma-associated antigen 10-like [Canis lupus baileyi]|nr:melanoma-associated antigen 10-like [Canis lupus familiaris]XP_025316498.1 melanoma-associated antigen 10-like [Canis lupus dingo]XP_038305050.1 melanoma-associated antigen 10-like [Canis lupus familiaris]XP_038442578.1 melanoma-associated antigen 10-like [Canis lupus familiaris]|eukprot:XP_022272024.1 melanoma-associated antigen 10-like [Canis lupus familiaris]
MDSTVLGCPLLFPLKNLCRGSRNWVIGPWPQCKTCILRSKSRGGPGNARSQGTTKISAASGSPGLLQSPQRACSSPTAMEVTPSIRSDQGSRSQEEEEPNTLQALPETVLLLEDAIDDKVADLVAFLLLKYRTKELTTQAEMLKTVSQDYQELFPVIFSQAFECMQLVFGVDVREVDSSDHAYVLVTALGLTCNEMPSSEQSVPKTGLLINILGVIFMDGNCAPEEDVWEVLGVMGVYDSQEHFIYGEPRELLTKIWVQEGYLEYWQVAGSDPACYEFLWGSRAHAETSKMKILEFLAKVNDTIPSAFPVWYEEALRDEEVRSQARVAARDVVGGPGPGSVLGPYPAASLAPREV